MEMEMTLFFIEKTVKKSKAHKHTDDLSIRALPVVELQERSGGLQNHSFSQVHKYPQQDQDGDHLSKNIWE